MHHRGALRRIDDYEFLNLALYKSIQNQKFMSRRWRENYTDALKPIFVFEKSKWHFFLRYTADNGMDLPGERDVVEKRDF